LKIEPIDVVPHPRARMRESTHRMMPKVGDG
jgi:hypothetical protein